MATKIFTCVLCKDLLKPPIILIKAVGNACDLCYATQIRNNETNFKDLVAVENNTLQALLEQAILPCKYSEQGCDVTMGFNQITKHQLKCLFRKVYCPLKNSVKWTSELINITQHFMDIHQEHVIKEDSRKNDIVINLNLSDNIIESSEDTEFLSFSIYHDDKCADVAENNIEYLYQPQVVIIKYKNPNSDTTYKVTTKILCLSEFDNEFNPNVSLKIPKQSYDVPFITLTFKIGTNRLFSVSKDIVRAHFVCPICNYSMKPPIYLCDNGHSFCKFCTKKIKKCSLCNQVMTEKSNYNLEKLAEEMFLPCLHDGCKDVTIGEDLTHHEMICNFRQYYCPFECVNFQGNFAKLQKHLHDDHSDNFFESNINRQFLCTTGATYYYCLGPDNNVFKCRTGQTQYEGNYYTFRVRGVRISSEENYLYEIRLWNQKKNSKCFKAEADVVGNTISFDANQLRSFFKDDQLKVSCEIRKN